MKDPQFFILSFPCECHQIAKKKALVNLENDESFNLHYFFPKNASKIPKGTLGKSMQILAKLSTSVHTQPKAIVSHTFPWWVSPCSPRN